MLGFSDVRVDRREDAGAAWERVLSADRPALVESWVDPNISIIPPHISFWQAQTRSSALIKNDPNELGFVLDSAKSVLAGMFAGTRGKRRRTLGGSLVIGASSLRCTVFGGG
jgi:pyruvate dehydrogenase (quinone)